MILHITSLGQDLNTKPADEPLELEELLLDEELLDAELLLDEELAELLLDELLEVELLEELVDASSPPQAVSTRTWTTTRPIPHKLRRLSMVTGSVGFVLPDR